MNNKRVLSKIDLGSFIKPNPYKKDIIYDPRGQWDHPGQNTRIPGGNITMQGVDYPVWAQPSVGPGTMMQPGQDYTFPGAEYVDEYPQMKKGGSKKKSSKYTRNIFATNKLFAESYLFKKPKKHQIFDPNASFYQDGGEANDYIETELTDDEIQAYRDGGYVVEESNEYKKGGAYYDDSRDAWVSADGTVGPNGPANYQDGGAIYTYSKRPGSYYKKEGNKWFISNSGTGGKYVPVKDPDGTRTKALNKGATVIMANPTAPKKDYSKVTPSYNKSAMVQSVAGNTEAERKQVYDDIQSRATLDKMSQNLDKEILSRGVPKDEKPLDMMDYFWTGAVAAPVALSTMGSVAAYQIPYTGVSVGTALNTIGGIHGATQIPNRIQDWNDVSSGKKTWQEATFNTLGTGLEVGSGLYEAIPAGYNLTKDIYNAGKGSSLFFNTSAEAQAARNLQEAGLLGKNIDPKIFGRYPNLAQTATKRALKNYNTSYRAVEPIVENMSMDDLVNMAKSGYNIDDPVQVAQYMTTTVPIGETGAYRAGLDLHPTQDAIYTGKYKNAKEAAQYLEGYGTHMSEVRPPMDFSEGNLNEWIENYYTNKLFGKIPAANDKMFSIHNPEAYASGAKFKPGVVGFSKDSEFWPYIGNKGDKLLESIRTTKIRKDGGENNYYSVKGSPGVYRKVNGKWEVDFNRSGNFQPLSKGDVAARTAVLNKQAKQMFDPMYDDMVNTKKSEYKEVPKQPAPIKKPKAQDKKAQEVFNKDFKITDESKAEKIKNEIEEDKKRFIENAKKEGYEATKEDLDNIEERGWNIYGNVGVTYDPGTIKEAPTEEKPQGLLDKAGDIISNPMTSAGFLMRGQGIPDYMQRDMDRGTFGYYSNGAFHTERNPLDFAVSDMTPLGLVSDARAVNSGIENGDAMQAGLGLLSFIPGFGEAKKVAQANNTVDAVHDASRTIDFTGPLKHNYQDVPEVLTGLRQRGNYWDKSGIKGEDLLHPDMINYHGTYSGRPLVEVKMPDGSSEMFYKSSGWAGKQGNAANGTTEGMWQVFGGHSDTPQISNWFIKDKDYQNYYGSNTFGTMAENMDKALMQKHGLNSVDELDNVLNFQERLSKINSYTPPKKKGGTSNNYIELELTPEEIQEYAKGGFIVEDISVPTLNQAQDGGEDPVPLDPHQAFLKNWYENRVFPQELEKARPILLEQLSKPFPEYVPTDRLPADAVAAYNYDDNIVETNKNYPAELIEGSKTHEDNHYVTRDANEYLNGPHGHLVEQNIIKPKDINTGNPEWDKAYKKNFEDIVAPEEMHSRIMTFRELAGFKPNQVITEKDVEDYFKKAGDKLDPDIQDIKQVTKGTKSIVELLNYMASNDGPSKDNIMDYAKNGGIVTSLTQKQINQYIKNGYIVESLD